MPREEHIPGGNAVTATPMLRQYQTIKAKHKDCILFFRLGDFYEMFYEDAQVGAKVLELVLTSRGKGTAHQVPMCGIPYHAAEGYIAKLIKAGLKVAICEQVEDPSQAQGIVKRDVIRTITSGTYLDETATDARYILSLYPCSLGKNSETFGLSFIDPSSGTIQTNQYPQVHRVIDLIARLPVHECIFPQTAEDHIKALFHHPLLKIQDITLSPHDDWCFNPDIAYKTLTQHFKLPNLRGFGIEDMPVSIASSGALLEYLKQMNKQPLRHIDRVSIYADEDYVFISPAASYGLELESLIKTINRTLTAMGKRKFRYWLCHPLKKCASILQRQAAVTILKDEPQILKGLKTLLSRFPDIEKSLSKLSCGYTQAKDLLALRNALVMIPDLRTLTKPVSEKNRLFKINDIPDLRHLLEKAIDPDMPITNTEGNIFRNGYHPPLDELRAVQDNGRKWLQEFQSREIRRTKINSLKVGFNKVFGYYIELTKANARLAPGDYIRKQTLVNAERYITPELKEYEEKILTARDKILKMELSLIQDLQAKILDESVALHALAQSIAKIDVLYALSNLAILPQYTAPEIRDDMVIDIKDGRHPVVEKTSVANFVPNDTFLDGDESHLIILTGPNMAGKSTYIRQIALLVILAQMGSYIPAAQARIGVVDKIFTRIGAHDDITKGQSTFMVEMNETADIINNLTERSLIILDEIGRGTSTYDGLSLAWALAEHFQKVKSRTLFATHFHELTALAEEKSGIKNYNVAVKEWRDEIIFLHKIVPGSTDDSYGIYVAKLAGVPHEIIARSRKILTQLEFQSNFYSSKPRKFTQDEEQMSFLGQKSDPVWDDMKLILESLDINSLTPLEALNTLQEMKKKIDGKLC